MNPWPLACAALRRNAFAAIALVALVALAGALAILASAEERAFRIASTRAADRFDIVVAAAGSAAQVVLTTIYLQPAPLDLMPAGVLRDLQADPQIDRVAPVAVTDSYAGHVIVATSMDFAAPAGLVEGHAPTSPHHALLGSAVSMVVGTRFSPQHGSATENLLESHEHRFELEVVGRAAATGTPWDRAIIVPIETAWLMHDEPGAGGVLGPPWPPARVPAAVVHPRTIGDAYRIRMRYRGNGTAAFFPAEVLVPLYRVLGDARDILTGLAATFDVLVLVAVVLAVAAMLSTQRGSFGVLRVLGAPPRFLFAVAGLQGLVVIGGGAVIAALIGSLAVGAVSRFASART
ncbi:MAG TPA: ABC transporter permease, partial [Casimicrobiaceae bacterium]|nr:ABC transporter permease [Casimicrobiaceae bacterium]